MVAINSVTEKDFHETEAGLIPVEWNCVTLGDVAKTKSGGTPSRKKPEYFDGEISWVKSGELNDTAIEFTEETITEHGLQKSSAKIFPQGTMLIALYGATVGKTAILSINAATNQAVCAVFPDKRLIPHFLMYQFIARRDELLRERYGGAQPNISQTIVRAFQTIIPPLPEQQRIIAVLKAIQDEIAAQEDMIRELHEFKRSTMERLFTYGVGDTLSETKMTEVGEIPVHWEVVELGNISEFRNGLNFSKDDRGSGTLFINLQDIFADLICDEIGLERADFGDKNISTSLLQHDDIIFVRSSVKEQGVGYVCLFQPTTDEPVTFCGFAIRCRLKTDMSALFLTYLLLSETYRSLIVSKASRMTITNISQKALASIPVVVPPVDEQTEIASLLTNVDEKIAVELDRKTAMEEFFRSMLQQLMTGQIRLLSDEGLPL